MNKEDNKQFFEEMEEAIKNLKPHTYTKEEKEQMVLDKLKELYLEKNPYSAPHKTVFGDPHGNWEFDRHNKIRNLLQVLVENGRQDLVDQFEQFKKDVLKDKEQEERNAIIEDLSKKGINIKELDENIINYIIYLEKRLKNLID